MDGRSAMPNTLVYKWGDKIAADHHHCPAPYILVDVGLLVYKPIYLHSRPPVYCLVVLYCLRIYYVLTSYHQHEIVYCFDSQSIWTQDLLEVPRSTKLRNPHPPNAK